jgi:hypothetical protein
VSTVAEFIDRIGYDAVELDRLSAGRLFQPGGPVFGVPLHRSGFELALQPHAAQPTDLQPHAAQPTGLQPQAA